MDDYKVLWSKKGCQYEIIADGYGLGICNDRRCDRPIIYDDKRVAYDSPAQLPKYVKSQFAKMAMQGKIWNRMDYK